MKRISLERGVLWASLSDVSGLSGKTYKPQIKTVPLKKQFWELKTYATVWGTCRPSHLRNTGWANDPNGKETRGHRSPKRKTRGKTWCLNAEEGLNNEAQNFATCIHDIAVQYCRGLGGFWRNHRCRDKKRTALNTYHPGQRHFTEHAADPHTSSLSPCPKAKCFESALAGWRKRNFTRVWTKRG